MVDPLSLFAQFWWPQMSDCPWRRPATGTINMVMGLGRFREHFAGHEECYALIGSTACDIHFDEVGLPFQATKDFDIVLCVEAVSAEFATVFGGFLDAGGYRADLAEFRERVSDNPEFDYKALKLPITLADAKALLGRYYRLDKTD